MNVEFVSWNVNGLRSLLKKPQWDWIATSKAQIIALQETKSTPEQLLPEIVNRDGWHSYWDSSRVKKGYSGVAVFSRLEPLAVVAELPDTQFQGEGRLLHLEFPLFHFFNVYFPNGGVEELDENGKSTGKFKRLDYKMGFFDSFFKFVLDCRETKPVIVCGDFNIAHKPIDLARPKQNEHSTGFLQIERDWMDKFTSVGFVDTFRNVHSDKPDQYTWWSYQQRARSRNVGWRIDYFFVSEELIPHIRDAQIYSNIEGSDHCPIGLSMDFTKT